MTQDPIEKKQLPFPMRAAKLSLFTPLVLFVIGLLMKSFVSNSKSRELEMVIGVINLILILGAMALGVISLACIPRYGRKGILGYACAGIIVNGLILVSCIFLLFGLKRVAEVFNAGYSLEEMQVMSEVMSNSQVVLNEAIGFRFEIPNGFVENPQPKPPNVLYSFVQTSEDGSTIAINIDQLGNRIAKQTVTKEGIAAIRRQLPDGSLVEHVILAWDVYELDAFVSWFSINDLRLYSCSVQIPLAREAIQINVAGVEEVRDECQLVLSQLLDSLKGVSNWHSQD